MVIFSSHLITWNNFKAIFCSESKLSAMVTHLLMIDNGKETSNEACLKEDILFC